MNARLKVYLETSFVSYLTGRPTTREPIAAGQAASRQWWAVVAPLCDLFVSGYVIDKERARQGQVFWGYNAAGELAPLPLEAILAR